MIPSPLHPQPQERHHKRSRLRQRGSAGISLAEALMVAAIFAIVSTVVLRTTGQSLRREELNSVTVELYGWLEGVQRKAMSIDPNLRATNPGAFPSCTVTFKSGDLKPGSVLATTPSLCAPGSAVESAESDQAVFLLPNSNANKAFVVQTFNGNAVTFSPRGTVAFSQDGSAVDGPLTVEIGRKGSILTRCLRVEPVLGFLAIGSMNNAEASDAQDCSEDSFEGTF